MRQAFKMKLLPGFEEEYQKRHAAIWPELAALLKQAGISEYAIYLDRETHTLFGILQAADLRALDELPTHPVMKRWWHFMSDIMETNEDDSPVRIPLQEMFYLP